VTAFLGLIVILPLVGHATWHAYRATILPPPAKTKMTISAVVGFSGLFDRPYGSSAVAETDCTLLVFSRKELKALIRSNPVEADSIIEGIITVLGEVAASLEARASEWSPESAAPAAGAGGPPAASSNS